MQPELSAALKKLVTFPQTAANLVFRRDPDLTEVLVATVQWTMGLQQIVVAKKPSSVAF